MTELRHYHGDLWHQHDGGDVPHGHSMNAANRAVGAVARVLIAVLAIIAALFLIRWAVTGYYIATHCTTVLGTRVCQ